MALSLRDCAFFGSAISESFALNDLEAVLAKEKLLEKPTGAARQQLEESWDSYRRKLRALGDQGGVHRVRHHVVDPLADRLGYGPPEAAGSVRTREDEEDGGFLYSVANGAKLRAWAVDLGTDLDAPNRRGRAYRFSPARVAERVLLAVGERVGLLTDGDELRVVIVDPARPGSHVAVALGRSGGWRGAQAVPDSYRLVRALASPAGVARIGAITEAARLAQTRVTRSLRDQARRAVEGFVQALMDHPANAPALAEWTDRDALARTLWREGLVVVYRLLFILKLEASADPARAFSFASTSLWRNTYSPNVALAPLVRDVVERGAVTGSFLADSLRATFRLFSEGLSSSELKVSALGGMLFGAESTPLISRLSWTEEGVAALLDNLLWTRERGEDARSRVHYGSLDVEDLGRVYEALLELEPGIADQPVSRLRRAKLEVIVDITAGAPYRAAARPGETVPDDVESDEGHETGGAGRSATETVWVQDIPKGRFFLRVGLGRKATGSYYTPHPFVRFLVSEALGPPVAARSSHLDPRPGEILTLKVLDPAMGSGHFLVEACRFLAEKLYEATRLCDGRAIDAERAAASEPDEAVRERLLAHARELRARVEELPDPQDELVAYLPSRVSEGGETGVSQSRALAICRRLVAVHCLYGVDKNPLAVELAKVSLWLESYAEGLPLTFLDHRLITGDSLPGPFLGDLLTYPSSRGPIEGLFRQHLQEQTQAALRGALQHVRELEATVGKDPADVELKQTAKRRLDEALAPFRTLARVWAGGLRLGADQCDDEGYEALLGAVAEQLPLEPILAARPSLRRMLDAGLDAVPFGISFPEVLHVGGRLDSTSGFDAVLANPPWDKPHLERTSFVASVRPDVMGAVGAELEHAVEQALRSDTDLRQKFDDVASAVDAAAKVVRAHVSHIEAESGSRAAGHIDTYHAFLCRSFELAGADGSIGCILGGGFAKNPAARPLRDVALARRNAVACLHFDNKRRLFADLPSILEFCLYVGKASVRTDQALSVARGLTEFEQLDARDQWVSVSAPALKASSERGGQLSIGELASVAVEPRSSRSVWKAIADSVGPLIQELNSSDPYVIDLARLGIEGDPRTTENAARLVRSGVLVMIGGRGIRDYDAFPKDTLMRWSPIPTDGARLEPGRPLDALRRAARYRLAIRGKCGSPKSNERSLRAAILPPLVGCNHGVLVENAPERCTNSTRLALTAVLNAFAVDFLVRPKVQVMIGNAILEDTPAPEVDLRIPLLVHGALRLSCVTDEFQSLWTEQIGNEWREPTRRPGSPVLEGVDQRWAVRAAIDAVVADAYGLDRPQYEHVLASFSHKSYPDAPKRCLEAYDELKRLGLARFCKKHDPYFDIPLVEALPKPALELPVPGEVTIPLASKKKGRSRALEAGQQGTLDIGDRLQRTRDEKQPEVTELRPAQASPRVVYGAAAGIADGRKEKVAILAAQIRAIEERTKNRERVVVDLPVYNLRAAAGAFDESQLVGTAQTVKFRASRAYTRRPGVSFFAAQIDGRSMEPSIPNGAWCVFRRPVAAILDGARVLVERHLAEDPERGGRYVVKEYRKDATGRPQLISTNSAFAPIEITYADRIIAEWVEVIEPVSANSGKR